MSMIPFGPDGMLMIYAVVVSIQARASHPAGNRLVLRRLVSGDHARHADGVGHHIRLHDRDPPLESCPPPRGSDRFPGLRP